ncbi:MAG: GGDEF domain-containing phosphodiesterase [Pseudomonadota bacterium]
MSGNQPLAVHSGEPPLGAGTIARLLGEFGLDEPALERLNALGAAIRREAPDLLGAGHREAVLAHAESGFHTALLPAGMSEPQKMLIESLSRGALGWKVLEGLLARWATTVNADEPAERIRRDCVPLEELLRAGALRVHAGDAAACAEALAAAGRFLTAQFAIVAAVAAEAGRAARSPAELMPDYAPFVEQLRARLAERAADGKLLAVLYVDCGVIGRIDGVWGFHVGDAVRGRIFGRMRSEVLRERDLLGEIGRDEFACVLDTIQSPGVAMLAAQKTLRTLNIPVRVAESEIYARPAIGIAHFPEHGESPASLLQRAKIACIVARDEIDRIAVYSEPQEKPHATSLIYENRLRAAIEQGALELVYQPQVRLSDRRVVAAESLLRWRDSELGIVPPSRAIAVAESAGLINEVTWWVLNSALRQCAEFRFRGAGLRIAVNLSANNLRERDLPDFIDRALRTWGLPGDALVVEVTETALLGATEEIRAAFERLKALGVRLAIDDFGTGYSSMNYLATMPFDEMKIDLSFVSDMARVPAHERIVRSLVDLAHNLGLAVVAEGVEDESVALRLAALGCDRMQGYYVGKPLDPEGFVAACLSAAPL